MRPAGARYMTGLYHLTVRNGKLFFKDKGMFFTSLITPLILLVLYATFLAKVYRDSFVSALGSTMMGGGMGAADSLIDATVAGQLLSSLLAVCCVTVAFCSNMLMVQDKVSGAQRDLSMTPVKPSVLAISYYLASAISTLAICLLATAAGLVYMAIVGWYMSVTDVLFLLLDVVLLVMFGTVLSSMINFFLTTQGQISAVGTIVSAGYGFMCGAYMPISQFGEGLQTVLSFLPSTYGTSLLRNHTLAGVYREMDATGFPPEVMENIRDSIDCNVYFFDHKVSTPAMYAIIGGTIALLLVAYVLLYRLSRAKARRKAAIASQAAGK